MKNTSTITFDSCYYSPETQSFILSRAERQSFRSRTSAYSARRSSKPKKGVESTASAAMHFAAVDPKRVMYLGRKSDFVASASANVYPKHVMINDIPHVRRDGTYVPMTMKSSTEKLVSAEFGVAEMYQLFMLADENDGTFEMYADLLSVC